MFLTLRDIKARYVQTALGWFWTVFQPLGLMLVFLFAFHRLGNVKTDGVVYPVFALAGLAFWSYFQRAVSEGSQSLVLNAPLLTKTSCPRLLMPLSAAAAPLVDLVTAYGLVLVFVFAYGIDPTWRWVVFPLPILLGVTLAAALGVFLSAVNVRYRDVRNALPFLVQFLLFLSPFAYSLSGLRGTAKLLISINPLVGIVEAIRWSLLATPPPSAVAIGFSCGITALILLVGLRYFSRFARDFADVA
jgi:lipopolysaccharide transport system permease protein